MIPQRVLPVLQEALAFGLVEIGHEIELSSIGHNSLHQSHSGGHRKEDFVKFEANMRNVDELMECRLVSGGYDDLSRFVSRNINHYQERIEKLL
jgi:DNA-binding Lrp family transcriptional regulator